MYLRLVTFQCAPDHKDAARIVAAEFLPQVRLEAGCLNTICFADDADGQSGFVVLWDTRENADLAMGRMKPKLEAILKGRTTAPTTIRTFPVVG